MPEADISLHGAPQLPHRVYYMFPAAIAALLSCAGCIVTSSTYETKVREVDSLRDAYASLNREKTKLAAENAALSKQVAEGKETADTLSAKGREKDESLKRVGDELALVRRNCEGSRLTREQFINELLEKEKATGRRMQDLSSRAEACEKELERERRDGADRNRELESLRKDGGGSDPDADQARRERDIMAGRVERLQEEQREASRIRDARLAKLAEEIGKVSPGVTVTPLGPALRIAAPEKVLLGEKGGKLTKAGSRIVSMISAAATELPSSSLVVTAGGRKAADAIHAAVNGKGKLPAGRMFSRIREKDKTTEFLLVAP